MKIGTFSGLAALALALVAAPAQAATFYVTTGLGTHETVVDASHPAIWTFNADNTYDRVGGAVVAIKHGALATFGVQLQLIDYANDLVAAVSYADVAAFVLAGGQDEYTKFVFALDSIYGVGLSPGDPYTLKLSLVGSGGEPDEAYSIRGLDGFATRTMDDPEDILVVDQTPVATPEPATALILAAGLLGLGWTRRCRAGVAHLGAICQRNKK